MVDVAKMEEAFELAKQVSALLADAGVFDTNIDTAGSFDVFMEDLEIDIVRAKSGDIE